MLRSCIDYGPVDQRPAQLPRFWQKDWQRPGRQLLSKHLEGVEPLKGVELMEVEWVWSVVVVEEVAAERVPLRLLVPREQWVWLLLLVAGSP